jgi:hypothetical protein
MTFSETKKECAYKYGDRIHSMKCIEVAWDMIRNNMGIIHVSGVGGGVKHRVQYGLCDHIRLQVWRSGLFEIHRSAILKSRQWQTRAIL